MKTVRPVLKAFFFAFGVESFVFTLISSLRPSSFTVKSMWAIIAITAFVCLCGTLMLKEKVSNKSLWLRRAALLGLTSAVCPAILILFGIVKRSTWEAYLIYSFAAVFFIVLCAVIAYMIADKIEKEALKKINTKLAQNK